MHWRVELKPLITVGKHDPNRLARYQEIHETVMEHLRRGGFVIDDTLTFTSIPGGILIEGKIFCQDGIYIDVHKELDILDGEGRHRSNRELYLQCGSARRRQYIPIR